MAKEQARKILVVARANGTQDRGGGERAIARVELEVLKLQEHLKDFLGKMHDVVANLPNTVGDLDLDTITLSVEISAKGAIGLLGTGAEAGAKGGMTFTLRKRTASSGRK